MGARRQSDYLIERARQMFPGMGADQKLKQMNYLLPHIRRIPQKLLREQFAADASQKLGIDSVVLREELRQAALRRRDHIEVRTTALTEVERVMLRALAITDPEHGEARRTAVDAVTRQPQWFEGLGVFEALRVLGDRGARDPMDAVENPSQRALLAEALLGETESPAVETVQGAIASLQQRKIEAELREMRVQIQEAERRGDYAELALLTQRKLELDRVLRQLRGSGLSGN
jgi:DNA primase